MAWLDDHPGHPLGAGYPPGASLRDDGHLQAWAAIVRWDPCSFCGGPGGTVDHIVPRSARRKGVNAWNNMAGACGSCNGSKGAESLLLFLAIRAGCPGAVGTRPWTWADRYAA
jgi:hypothetical protein